MGANNWRECPQCKVAAIQEHEDAKRRAAESYGKVSADKYAQLIKAAQQDVTLDETLREDWEIGMFADGEFLVSYGASCERCRFRFRFEHKANALEERTPD